MSIATEITRLQDAKAALKTSIEAKGVTVADSAKLDEYPALVDKINGDSSDSSSGGGCGNFVAVSQINEEHRLDRVDWEFIGPPSEQSDGYIYKYIDGNNTYPRYCYVSNSGFIYDTHQNNTRDYISTLYELQKYGFCIYDMNKNFYCFGYIYHETDYDDNTYLYVDKQLEGSYYIFSVMITNPPIYIKK